VRTFGGGTASEPVRAFGWSAGGSVTGPELGFCGTRKDEFVIAIGCVTATLLGGVGMSTSFRDAVGRFTWTGAGVPSGDAGRPGDGSTPLLASGLTGSVSLRGGTFPVGGRGEKGGKMGGALGAGAGVFNAGCGAIGSGTRGTGGAGGAAATGAAGTGGVAGSGGGVASTGGLGSGGVGTGGAGGSDADGTVFGAVIPGSACVEGSAGGWDWCGIGAMSSFSSTVPV
jgi:hypothetical protein